MKNTLFNAAMALLFGFIGAGIWSYSGLADARTKSYLMGNPQILPEMAEAFQKQETRGRLTEVADEVMTAFPGAVMGNPNGSKVLVEFSDYNCGFCQKSHGDVTKLIAEDPEVKVVMRELPIFDGSEDAARMSLAAAKQGLYTEFHAQMFKMSPANAETARAAARAAGMDMAKAEADAKSPEVDLELVRSRDLAQALGFSGTPSWVVTGNAFEGAVGFDGLKEALDEAGSNADS
ncbi:MAG: DsbA family protein [Erythrobacter sp.]